jgi:predicted enzyme related to lactoylglutathione lyase
MKVIGIGGVFWRTKDIKILKKWYKDVLGISLEDWNGTVFHRSKESQTIFSFFSKEDAYFPIEQPVMLNFQIDNIEEWIDHLNRLGISIVKEPEQNEFGKFIWISDPDGRWIELWEK